MDLTYIITGAGMTMAMTGDRLCCRHRPDHASLYALSMQSKRRYSIVARRLDRGVKVLGSIRAVVNYTG